VAKLDLKMKIIIKNNGDDTCIPTQPCLATEDLSLASKTNK